MMNHLKHLNYLLLVMISLGYISCSSEIENHIPEKHPDISIGKYDKYLGLLKDAYKKNDKIEAAIQLANLKADKKITFEILNAGINENPDQCEKVYDWYWMFERHNFGVNIVTLDTLLFKKSVELCNKNNEDISYMNYAIKKDNVMQEARENKEKEDSTNFNLKLVKQLEQIYKDDQGIRNRIYAKNISPYLKDKLYKEMNLVDSLNLIKIDQIFKEYGYPSRELVGKECNFTPALVIHHSNDLTTRYKYLPFLEKSVQEGLLFEGTLNMIKIRIEDMELDQKQ